MADSYTHGHHASVLRTHSWRTVENSAAYLLRELVAGCSVLDVGAGPGTITVDIARLVAPAPVVGIDASTDVVAAAEAAALGIDNVSFRVGDAYALPFPDDAFDVVYAHQVLQHLARPVDALREFRRVSAGVVAARDVHYEGAIWYPQVPGVDEWRDVYLRVHWGLPTRASGRRGGSGSGTAPEGVGAAGRIRRGDRIGIRLALRVRRGPRPVGRRVSRAGDRVVVRDARAGARLHRPRRTAGDRRGVGAVGRRRRRVAAHAARGDPRPGSDVAGAWRSRSGASRSGVSHRMRVGIQAVKAKSSSR